MCNTKNGKILSFLLESIPGSFLPLSFPTILTHQNLELGSENWYSSTSKCPLQLSFREFCLVLSLKWSNGSNKNGTQNCLLFCFQTRGVFKFFDIANVLVS